MELEEAIKILQKTVKSNNEVIKEARKNGDINVMQLTTDLDNQSIAIETVLQALENSIPKKKIEDKIEEFEDKKLMIEITRYLDERTTGIIGLIQIIINNIRTLLDGREILIPIDRQAGKILDKYEKLRYKEKIENKIELLKIERKKALRGLKGQDRCFVKQEYLFKIDTLQELLEEN